MSRICCSPFWAARQPGPLFGLKTDSMGKPGSSDVTSTVAISPRSIQRGPEPGLTAGRSKPTILFRTFLFSLIQASKEHTQFLLLPGPQRAHHRTDQTQMIGERGRN